MIDYKKQIASILLPLLGGHTSVSLIIYPHHWNVGDSAIWYGTVETLKYMGIKINYIAEYRTYLADDLKKHHPDGPILLCGGGNFGDIYPNEASLRKRIITDFANRPIIQLPQSIRFSSETALKEMSILLESHSNFTLLVRENMSLEIAQKSFNIPTQLCPDMAMALFGRLPVNNKPTTPVIVLRRDDGEINESNKNFEFSANTPVFDWQQENSKYIKRYWSITGRVCYKIVEKWIGSTARLHSRTSMRLLVSAANQLAKERTIGGTKLLLPAEAIITDRLHAAIMARMAQKQVIVVDNSYQKNSSVYKAWFSEDDKFSLADTFEHSI